MASSSMYQMHEEYDKVESKGQEAERAHGTAARCLPNSAHGRATAILYVLYVLLALGFVLFTVLFTVQFGKQIRNLTHNVWKELAEMKQNTYGLEEKQALSRVQEELRSITEIICTKCPPGWQHFEKKCYFFSTSATTWSDADQFCATKGSHLAIINTLKEQAFLSSHVIAPHNYWLGLSDSVEEGEWKWLDGSSLSIKFWAAGEPNNSGKDGEDCGTLRFDKRWNDLPCFEDAHWICEQPC